jgi:hypothetical protein
VSEFEPTFLNSEQGNMVPRSLFICLHQGEIFDAMYDLIDHGYDEDWVNGPGHYSIVNELAIKHQVGLVEG